ncbi:phasin family protein [Seohaeicola zhoushanensis]|uniref:Phasin domain-containing protein n=1 Tax=Seohaeicola zhoushanensis TaxID=1569283 RepID=A0A8J3H2I5_9RHOB|nr:phasin family protein [Seohaeicola zhoushanensis]GHF69619.1 hypothetical protein GCM10017056_45920 [Seohaeicola zhoushanensis]
MATKKTGTTQDQLDQAGAFVAQLSEAGKAFVTGTIEVDRMILGQIADGAKGTVAHGQALLGVKDVKSALELQAGFVQASLEQGIANTREVMEAAQANWQAIFNSFGKAA